MEKKPIDKRVLERSLQKLRTADLSLEDSFSEELDRIGQRLERKTYHVAVAAETPADEISFFNALFGKKIIFSSCDIPISVGYGEKKRAFLYNGLGELTEKLPLEYKNVVLINRYLSGETCAADPLGRAEFRYPVQLLRYGIILQGGVGGTGLEEADAVIYLAREQAIPAELLQKHRQKAIRNLLVIRNGLESGVGAEEEFPDIPVLEADLEEYLLGRDNWLYREYLASDGEKKEYGQEELRTRSQFEEMLKELNQYFKDRLNVDYVLRTMGESIITLSEAMAEAAVEKEKKLVQEKEAQRLKWEENRKRAAGRKQEYFGKLAAERDSFLNAFSSYIAQDIGDWLKDTGFIRSHVEEAVKNPQDLCEGTLEGCLRYTQKATAEFAEIIGRTAAKACAVYAENYLGEGRKEESGQFFKEPPRFLTEMNPVTVQADTAAVLSGDIPPSPGREGILEYEKKIVLEEELLETDRADAGRLKNAREDLLLLKERQRQYEEEYRLRIEQLGPRPKPEPRYETVYWTTGTLLWKKQHSRIVPQKPDTKKADQWLSDMAELESDYKRKTEALRAEQEQNEKKLEELEFVRQRITTHAENLKKLRDARELEIRRVNEKEQENIRSYLSAKRADIAVICEKYCYQSMERFLEAVKQYLREFAAESDRLLNVCRETCESGESEAEDQIILQIKELRTNTEGLLREIAIAGGKVKEEIGDGWSEGTEDGGERQEPQDLKEPEISGDSF